MGGMNLNMFINNMMMGGMPMGMGIPMQGMQGMQGMDGLFMFGHQPPPVASQDVINANTQQDTFHVDDNDNEEGKHADADADGSRSGKEEQEGDGKEKKKKKKEQCSICLEEFK